MNTNINGMNGYYSAIVSGWQGDSNINWGFSVREDRGSVFTVELAKQLLEKANNEYKKGCPDGYYKPSYNPNINFTFIKYDMTDYRESIDIPGRLVPVGKRKIGTYDSKKNLLRIYINDEPIYENNNGKICKDTVAMMDCDADGGLV